MNLNVIRTGFAVFCCFLFLCLVFASQSIAQTPENSPNQELSNSPSQILISEDLTREAFRDVLSGLTNDQLRTLILDEFEKNVAEREQELLLEQEADLESTLSGWGNSLTTHWGGVVTNLGSLDEETIKLFTNVADKRGDRSYWSLFGFLVLSWAIAILASRMIFIKFFRFIAGQKFNALIQASKEAEPDNLSLRVKIGIIRLIGYIGYVITFLIVAELVNWFLNYDSPIDFKLSRIIIESTAWVLFAIMFARFLLAPFNSELRLCRMSDEKAKFLTYAIGFIFGWYAFTSQLLFRLAEFGWPLGLVKIGFWFNFIYYALIIATIWYARREITNIVIGEGEVDKAWNRFGKVWPYIAIMLVSVQWLIIELIVATGNIENLPTFAANATLVILLVLPFIETALPAIILTCMPIHEEYPEHRKEIRRHTRETIKKCARLLVLLVALETIFALWGIDWSDVAAAGLGTQIAAVVADIIYLAVVAYILHQALILYTERKVILEKAEIADDPSKSGGLGITRFETIVPLLRWVGTAFIVLYVVFQFLYDLGVNILPLLAGASVVGLAIGLGAQAFIRDIIAGLFFLMDDAFRKDEYIDIGKSMGAVEKLSLRSMQLRHETGLLITIPFGEISHVINYSRDWGIMQIHLRVPFDTDLERLGEMINKTGEDLLKDPDIGDKYTVKLTSLGAVNTDDSAIIFRVAYKTKALDQWPMRGKTYAAIREMFEREGFQFAAKEVAIRMPTGKENELSEADKMKIANNAAAELTS